MALRFLPGWAFACLVSLLFGAFAAPAQAENVSLAVDVSNGQAGYAATQLRSALERQQHVIVDARQADSFPIVLTIKSGDLAPQAYAIEARPGQVTITGGDGRGLIYGTLALVEQLDKGTPIRKLRSTSEKPTVSFRAIKFDLPWDSYRASAAIDQHRDTVRDTRYWTALLDMMVRNRFNAITLSNLHPWPYMVRTKGFEKANPFDDRELEEWKQLHRTIFRLAKERGIDTYLLPFNIFVSKEFAEAYGVGKLNTYPRYNTKGERSPIVRDYVRASIGQVLEEYPDLTGLGINLGEGMGEMTAAERLGYVNDTYLAAIRDARRPVKLMWSINSVETKEWQQTGHDPRIDEQMLRDTIEKIDFVDGPIQINFKFNWSHALSTTRLAQIHGGKLGETYFTPAPKNYRIDWIARNEDVLALRWGVPSFVREHVKANGTPSYVGGYTVGSETYIPARDYFTALPDHSQWTYAFERQWLFYMLWGRLLYNPDMQNKVFEEEFVRRYGGKGRNLLAAYERASATPLRLASLFYSQWDHTLYSEGMMWLDGRTMEYISVDDLIRQPVLDPTFVNIADYVAAATKGQSFPAERMTPPKLADRLEADSREALRLVKGINPGKGLALPYEVADVRAWAHLGLHLAAKIRGGVALQTFRATGDTASRRQALTHLKAALAEWDEVVKITDPLYQPMWLTHFTGQSSALNPDAKFHWNSLRGAVAKDVELVR